jgi:uncharacterized protein
MGDTDNVTQLHASSCPICGKPAAVGERPFCSARCRDADLSRWLKGGYRLPTEEPMGGEGLGEGDSEIEEEQE